MKQNILINYCIKYYLLLSNINICYTVLGLTLWFSALLCISTHLSQLFCRVWCTLRECPQSCAFVTVHSRSIYSPLPVITALAHTPTLMTHNYIIMQLMTCIACSSAMMLCINELDRLSTTVICLGVLINR